MPIVVTNADISSAILRIDGAAKGVDAIFASCATLDAGTKAAWSDWYAAWQEWATANDDLGYFTLGLAEIGNQAVGYESDVAQWQTIANQKCGSQVPVLVPETDVANANASIPSTWSKAIPWIVGGIALVVVAPPLLGWAREASARRQGAPEKNPIRHFGTDEAAKRFVRAKTKELIERGYPARQAYAIANREAGTSTLAERQLPAGCTVRREYLNAGGYTYGRWGTYFGHGAPLYRADCDDWDRSFYVRASSRAEAVEKVRSEIARRERAEEYRRMRG